MARLFLLVKYLLFPLLAGFLGYGFMKATASPDPGAATRDFYETTTLPRLLFPLYLIILYILFYHSFKRSKRLLRFATAFMAMILFVLFLLLLMLGAGTVLLTDDMPFSNRRFSFPMEDYLVHQNAIGDYDLTDGALASLLMLAFTIAAASITVLLWGFRKLNERRKKGSSAIPG